MSNIDGAIIYNIGFLEYSEYSWIDDFEVQLIQILKRGGSYDLTTKNGIASVPLSAWHKF